MNELPKKIGPYSIFGSLGSGGYGQVLIGRNSENLQNYAIKISTEHQSLKKEYKILETLSNLDGFLDVYEYGHYNNYDYIVMELLSRNLHYKENDSCFTLKCIFSIGVEILNKIEAMHNLDIIHKDIKPSQFLLSHDFKKVYLVDYGLASFFRHNGLHKEFKTRCNFKGSVMFASINNHMGFRQSRRDDLECLIYSLIFLIKRKLPWAIDNRISGFEKWKMILNMKLRSQQEELFLDVPHELNLFYKYTRRLQFEQTPDYDYLKGLLMKFVLNDPLHANFDWIINPNLFNKVKSYVKVKGKKSTLHLINTNGEFVSNRRNGKLNVFDVRKGGKSVTFNHTEKEVKLSPKRNSSIIQLSDNSKTIESDLNNKETSKNHKSVSRSKKKIKSKARVKTCDKLLVCPLERKDHMRSPTYILPSISLSPSTSAMSMSLNVSDDPVTPKTDFPEFSNRSNIFRDRKTFIEEYVQKVPEKQCIIC